MNEPTLSQCRARLAALRRSIRGHTPAEALMADRLQQAIQVLDAQIQVEHALTGNQPADPQANTERRAQ